MKTLMVAAVVFVFSVIVNLSAPSALTLELDGAGQLIGAQGVLVGLTEYDVIFADSTCGIVFDGCDDASIDFTFQTRSEAEAASQALLDQVFIDSALGSFDSVPGLTLGCGAGNPSCGPFTPFTLGLLPFSGRLTVEVARALNSLNEPDDRIVSSPGFGFIVELDLSDDHPQDTWAKWSIASPAPAPSPAPIPEPGTIILMGSGLVGLFVFRKRFSK